MWKQTLPLLAAFSFLATAQGAEQSRMKAVEQAIETSSAELRLPDRAPAIPIARNPAKPARKRACKSPRTTQFFLGKNAVTQTEFNRAVQQSTTVLGIFLRQQDV